MIKVIIADDDDIFRNGLKIIIEQDSDIKVCGLAGDGNAAYNLCKSENPDIVLMDMQMPYCDGSSATYKIKQEFPNIKILVLTIFDDKATITKALSSGADGYVLKDVDENKIINAIKSTLLNINVFGKSVFDNLKNKLINNSTPAVKLTNRETELIVNVAKGLSNKEIAKTMFLSEGTVRNNISALLLKLKLRDRTQLAVYAVKNDYI